MAKERLDGDKRREQIIWAAVRLAAEGAGNVTLKGVAEAIGVVPSALYRHFRNKDSIMDSVLETIVAKLMKKAREAGATESDALTAIRRLGKYHARLFMREPGVLQLMFSEASTPRNLRNGKIVKVMGDYRGVVGELVAQGQTLGQIRADILPEDLAYMYVGTLIPPAFLYHLSGGQFDVLERFERSFALIEEMARVRRGESDAS